MSLANTIVVVGVSLVGWGIYKVSQIGKRAAHLPPGPPTIPILGNLNVYPKSAAHFRFTEWAKQYGEIFSLKIAQGTVVVITSASATRELLDKNSALTSNRPGFHMFDVVFDGMNIPLVRYGDTWRKLRHGVHEILTPQACQRHLPIQQAEATQLLYDILTHPEGFYDSIRRYSASVLLSVVFGKRAPQSSTAEVVGYFRLQTLWEELITPGAQPPIDLIPILQKVPERFASWKTTCKLMKKLTHEAYFGRLDEVEKRMARGEANGCFMETLCSRAKEWGLNRDMVGHIGGVLFDTGADTTSGLLQSFVLALVAYPEVQKKAHAEIDAIIGTDRAPTLEDVAHLPYIQAVIKEIHRFRPVTPLSVPHAANEDVTYKGYTIPAGTVIFANLWGILHDEEVFENESVFNPDRYMKNPFGVREGVDTKDWKDDVTFGYGRRACPGLHLAKNSVAINVVNLLWAFDFGKYKDPSTGLIVEPDVWDYANGLATFPHRYKCTITPRSPRHAGIIRQQLAEATSAYLPFEQELTEEDRSYIQDQRKGL